MENCIGLGTTKAGGNFMESNAESSGWIELSVRVKDPVAVRVIRMVEARSNAGAGEYGCDSILEKPTPAEGFILDALEEGVDLSLYLMAALARLTSPRG